MKYVVHLKIFRNFVQENVYMNTKIRIQNYEKLNANIAVKHLKHGIQIKNIAVMIVQERHKEIE